MGARMWRRSVRALRRVMREERKWVAFTESMGMQLQPWQIDLLTRYASRGRGVGL